MSLIVSREGKNWHNGSVVLMWAACRILNFDCYVVNYENLQNVVKCVLSCTDNTAHSRQLFSVLFLYLFVCGEFAQTVIRIITYHNENDICL